MDISWNNKRLRKTWNWLCENLAWLFRKNVRFNLNSKQANFLFNVESTANIPVCRTRVLKFYDIVFFLSMVKTGCGKKFSVDLRCELVELGNCSSVELIINSLKVVESRRVVPKVYPQKIILWNQKKWPSSTLCCWSRLFSLQAALTVILNLYTFTNYYSNRKFIYFIFRAKMLLLHIEH